MTDTKTFEAANAAYEHLKALGKPVSIGAIEKEFGLEKGKLGNWRSNRKRLKNAREGEAVGADALTAATEGEFQEWDLDDISMHGNIRKEFGVEELQSLANSLRTTKLLQLPLGYIGEKGGKPHLYLCVGERRLRAHELRRDRGEEVRTMKVRVIDRPSEREFLRMNFVENLQRVNLRPSEVARGIQDMLDLRDEETGVAAFNVRTLAEELGMRYQGVQDAVNSLQAPPRARKALDEGRVAADVVGQIGSLPEAMREQATEEMIFGPGGAMSQKEARAWVANRYRRDLRKADFDTEDEALLPEVGACTGCRWWGGNRDDLEGKAANFTCLNPRCFLEKQAAAAEREKSQILAGGADVVLMSAELCKEVFDAVNGRLDPQSGYVNLDAKPDPYYLEDGDRNRGAAPKWREAIGRDMPTVHVAWDPAGKRVELVEVGPAMVAALNGGYAPMFRAKAAEGLLTAEEEALQRSIKAAMEREGRAVCVEGARDLYGKLHKGKGWDRTMVRSLVRVAAEQGLKPDDYHFLCEMLEPGVAKAQATGRGFLELVDLKCGAVDELLALLAMILQVRSLRYNGFEPWVEEGNPMGDLCVEVGFKPEDWHTGMKQRKRQAERRVRKEAEAVASKAKVEGGER